MRVLLVSLNTVATPYPVFPLGVAYLRDAVMAAGHEMHVFDCLLERDDALEDCLQRFVPDVVGFSLRNIDNVRADDAVSYIAGLRASVERVRAVCTAKVIFGGAEFSVFPQEILELTGADFGIRGEGELAFPQLLSCLDGGGGDLRSVPGLLFRNGEGESVSHRRPTTCSKPHSAASSPL